MSKRKGIATLVVLILVLLGLHLGLRLVPTRVVLPTRNAQWIWLPDADEDDGPVAFYAARDFEVSGPPEFAELTVAADEEALVFLNTVPIGGTRYANGESLRRYDVREAMRQGANRIVVEVRSARGVGGLLLRLEVRVDRTHSVEVVSDASWTLLRRPDDSLFDDSLPLAVGESPRVWGPAPTGRWTLSSQPVLVPTIAALRTSSNAVGAERFRIPSDKGRWQRLGKTDRSSPALGNWVVFDFGSEIMAYIALRFPAQVAEDARPVGLLYLGSEPGISNRSRADARVVAMPGQRVWLDAKPRRFRYATFVGLTPVSGADAYQVDPVRADKAWPHESPTAGPFGLPVADLGPSLEDEIWRELHGLPSVAVGE